MSSLAFAHVRPRFALPCLLAVAASAIDAQAQTLYKKPLIAFSVSGTDHTSFGGPVTVSFQSEHLDEGNGWTNNAYIAPASGLYYFHLSGVRDSLYNGGTWDDAFLNLTIGGSVVGRAWAGQFDSLDAAKRMTGAYSVARYVQKGEVVTVTATSDGNPIRHFAKYELSGIYLGPITAFSASGVDHTSIGNADQLTFQGAHCNLGACWKANQFFQPPRQGIYFFSGQFVRDSATLGGTSDDVMMDLLVGTNGVGRAWAGEANSQDAAKRMTGAFSFATHLPANGTVTANSSSDGGFARHLAAFELTGFKVLPAGPLTGAALAFSASGSNHISSGSPIQMVYQTEHVDTHNAWDGSTFTAPVQGCYYFELAFVRDSSGSSGTGDDVYVNLDIGGTTQGYGWAGEALTSDGVQRMTGAYSTARFLTQGQTVTTRAGSDGNVLRHVAEFHLTGFLLGVK
ncbi:MAG: hypothetical protein IT453_03360 [Planctomycetes bacterium]|nr:hypothetical protein [Planctomycetota bacterium]